MAKPNKAVVVFSGGQDSTTCLFWAKKKYDEVIALSFNYGQRHSKELECAKKICKAVSYTHLDVYKRQDESIWVSEERD